MLLVTPFVPLASASALNARVRPAGTYLSGGALAPAAAIVNATKTDSFPDPDGDNKAEPGQAITYDINVSNTGASAATGVTLTDTIDPNTTLVPGSLRVSPLAFADTYNATKEVALNIPAPGVLANDTGTPAPTAQPIAAGATTQGGTVTLNADGSFNYTPPAGFEGSDTFTYTATNGTTPNDTATVTVNVDAGPAVTTTSPANGTTSVAQNADITVNFTEPVNATTGSFSVQCPAGSPQTFTLSASPAASFTLDPSADLPAGTTCTVTVFANQITDADNFDPPDQMAADYAFSFGVKPLAVDDMRSATGNVRINTAVTGYSVLTNDQAPGATITAFDATSANGGGVNVNTTTGTFTYDPPRGFTGTDSFNYTLSNGGGSDTGTVVLTVTDMIWFVNNAPGACVSSCDGRLSHPYTGLAAFDADNGNGGANPEAGDNIFIYTGGGSYTGPLTLEDNQRVIGQGATSTLAALAGITFAPDSDTLPSTGGTNPAITSASGGIVVAQNDSIHGLSVVNTAGTGIAGNNFGTLTVSENVVVSNTTTAGTAVSLSNGALAASFRSISAGNNDASPDPATGIVLAGTTGSFAVTGDGSTAGSGGTIQNTTNNGVIATNATNISLSWMNLTNAATADGGTAAGTCGLADVSTCNAAVELDNVTGVTLDRVNINGSAEQGILGTNVTGFSISNSTVQNAGNEAAENGAYFLGLYGIVLVSNTTFTGSAFNNFGVLNTGGSTQLDMTVTGSTFSSNSANGGDGLVVDTRSGTNSKIKVSSNTFTANKDDHVSVVSSGSAVTEVTISGNTLTGGHATAVGQGITMRVGGSFSGTFRFDIANNSINGAIPTAVNTGGGSTTSAAVIDGTIRNNTIGTSGVTFSGSKQGSCILVESNGLGQAGHATPAGTYNVLVQNNILRQCFDKGVDLLANRDGNANTNITVADNSVNELSGPSSRWAVRFETGSSLQDETGSACLDIKNNTLHSQTIGDEMSIRQRSNIPVSLPGYLGGPNNDAAAAAYLVGRNTNGGPVGSTLSATATHTLATNFLNGGAQCAQPSLPSIPQTSSFRSDGTEVFSAVQTASAPSEPRVWSDIKVRRQTRAADVADASSAGDSGPAFFGARIVRASYERPSSARARRKTVSVGDAGARPTAGTRDAEAVNAARARALTATLFSGETVNANVGTLPAGKTVRIVFQVTVDNPFTGAQPQVANQGTVSGDNFASVLTDDPSVGGAANPTVTPILTPPSITIKDASVAEPATGSAPAAFAVTLSHAYTHAVTVNYATADDTGGANPATSGTDYTVASGTLTFNPGETVQTVSAPVLADADASETAETFLVNLSNNSANSTIGDGQAVGTITPDSTPGTVVISELRTSGPAGADDEFVELYNNTDVDITVAASDASGGWALVKSGSGCGATPVAVAVIPNGTVIRARGNYLVTGSAYSLGTYAAGDQALVFNLEDDRNVALFNTADLGNVSTATRLDAVGFGANTGNNCDLLWEGATLQPAAGSTSEYSFVRKVDKGGTQDTNDNAADFIVVSTTPATPVGGNTAPVLGAPGPESSTGARGPVPCNVTGNAKFGRERLDSTAALGSAPNTVRDATPGPNAANGTIDFRRRFTNNTGGAVTQLRFRITNMKNPPAPGTADLRALSSAPTLVTGVNDTVTCGGSAPCNVTVAGTTLEQPPAQGSGGGINSTLGVGVITLGSPLASGASVNLHLLFGVQQIGDYHVSIVIETATTGSIGQDVWELRGNTETGGHSEGGCNTPPVADAGADQNIECGGVSTSVALDGTGSSDADGDTLAYEWREGATVLGATATLNTSLAFGSHTITLKVTDPSGDFSEDTVVIDIVDTTDPLISAPPNVSVNTGPGATSCGAFVSDATLGNATASDGCSASVIITRTGVPAGNIFPVGTTVVTYTADDGHGHTKKAYQIVTVTDNTPPAVTAPADIEVNAPANSCSVSLDPGTATGDDNCPGVAVAGVRSDAQPLNAPYPVGTTTITWTATDASGNTASAAQTVKVKDVTAPDIVLTAGTINLSTPNHQYATFSISDLVASVSDGCDAGVDINDVVISQATSDEPENASGNGDGNTVNDIVIAPDCKSLQLRSEREGGGNGRVYTITLKVKDSSGNVATATRKVFVPKSGQAVDNGAQYTVNGCLP